MSNKQRYEMSVETILLQQGLNQKLKIEGMQKVKSKKELGECTFHPNINASFSKKH
jgi:hypothetical protein